MCRCRPIGHQFISIFETVKLSRPSGTLWNSRGAHFSCNIAKAINHQFSTRKSGDKKKKGTPPPSSSASSSVTIPIAVVNVKRPGRSLNFSRAFISFTVSLFHTFCYRLATFSRNWSLIHSFSSSIIAKNR